MARRRRKNSTSSVSLFPFLSILACVIGTLTLLIVGLALGQMSGDDLASANRLHEAESQIKKLTPEIQRLQREIANSKSGASETQKLIAELQARSQKLKAEEDRLVKLVNTSTKIKIPQVDEAHHKKVIEELLAKIAELQEQIKKLRDEIAKKKLPPEEARVLIRPGGTGVNIDPTFVECAAGSIVIYEGKKETRVRRNVLKTDKHWTALLDRLAKNPKASIIFLVRDDGLGTYRDARNVAQEHYTRNGKLPVIGHGKIDLSIFQKK